jgi:hypothetical protein
MLSRAGRAAAGRRELATAVWKTWGGRGLVRRAVYEGAKRTRARSRAERRWADGALAVPHELRRVRASTQAGGPSDASGITVYGALRLDTPVPPDWHRHPLTGHVFDADAHWSVLSDSDPVAGDIKDVWELGRLAWLHPVLRRFATTADDAEAERIWYVVEDWCVKNRPFTGPHWMCGQETSLRAINVMFLSAALADSAATTERRRALAADLVARSVGRVSPTLGYARSQRNNHAISEAGFLWTAAVLLPGLPGAARLRHRASRALTESVVDQFAEDGSYAQHSPTYQRLALHVLLWCLFVSRQTGVPAPAHVEEAVKRSVPFLRSLVAPGSEGCVPNLGGNDGALLFDLAPAAIGDLRPVIAHAAAATGQPSGLGPGPWDLEAAWFGLGPSAGTVRTPGGTLSTHALTRDNAHAVVRAGPLRHRPAHADQLHTDVWIGGRPVAVDAGSYRYTAVAPWGNALAGEDVHNLPRRVGAPQATRAGRFFWRRWAEAQVVATVDEPEVHALVAALTLPDGIVVRRLVATFPALVLVVDQATAVVDVRWNLAAGTAVAIDGGCVTSSSAFAHGMVSAASAEVIERRPDAPASGWHAPTYGVLEPVQALLVRSGADGRVTSWFCRPGADVRAAATLSAVSEIDLAAADEHAVRVALRRAAAGGGADGL